MRTWTGLVDAVSDADGDLCFGEAPVERKTLVATLLERRVPAGRGAGFFQPSEDDFLARRLVTGERLKTKLATTYIMSEEAARLLHAVAPGDAGAAAAVERATARLAETCFALQHCTIGECAASFIGYVRFLRGVRGDAATPEIVWRLRTLTDHRDGRGGWKRFPPFYTALVLTELPLPAARDELAYAEGALRRGAQRGAVEEPYAARRRRILERVDTRLAESGR